MESLFIQLSDNVYSSIWKKLTFTFIFMLLADAFIQSDSQVKTGFVVQVHVYQKYHTSVIQSSGNGHRAMLAQS